MQFLNNIRNRIHLFLWKRRWNKKIGGQSVCLVPDTCVLLRKDDRQKLERLREVFVPRAVIQQLYRMGENNSDDETSFSKIIRREAQKAKDSWQKMIKAKKWDMSGSTGSGIVHTLQDKRVVEFDSQAVQDIQARLTKRKIKIINQQREQLEKDPIPEDIYLITLEQLLGISDLRVIATAIKLWEEGKKNVFLVTYDKIMILIAESLGVKTIQL